MTRKDYILIANALNFTLHKAWGHDATNGTTGKVGNNAAGVMLAAGQIAHALEADNPRFDRMHFLAVVRGDKALTSRPAKKIKAFKVAAISTNTNSFGLHNVVLVAKDGEAWQVKASGFNVPKQGQIFQFEQTVGELIAQGWELPEKISNAPASVLAEVWS